MESTWTSTVKMNRFPPLWSDARTDVLVIGGGIAGLLCANALQEAGVRCAVAEAKTIAAGITKNATEVLKIPEYFVYWGVFKAHCGGKRSVQTAKGSFLEVP